MIYVAAIFLPLLGAVLAGLFGPFLGDRGAQVVSCGAMLLAAALGCVIFWQVGLEGQERTVHLLSWMSSGTLDVSWSLKFDTLSAVMVFVVTVVSCVVHWYSIGYMHGDPGVPRFFGYLSLFTFVMLMLVTATNLVQMFFGWEGVGLCSYFLIGFWYDRPAANAAAIKAFIVNRIGDFGFALGIFGTYFLFDTVNLDTIFAAVGGKEGAILTFLGMHLPALETLCVLLFIGAMGKSAQIGLHTWLPDAMEGPTPVSALIHAATMVTAGVFMVCRLSPMFEHAPFALGLVTIVGATTAFFAATVGLVQNDIKRVIAYSTCSQLGYMFLAAGVSAYSAAIFHLMTHAFFKALLFLAAGSVIHAMSGEQDMRKMGGLWRKIPITYGLMWIGSLSLAGLPPFAGFFSKDVILESAWGAGTALGNYAYVMGVGVAFMTAFYSWRLLFMTFHGASRADHHVAEHVHELPNIMIVPLYVLALGAVVAGWVAVALFVGAGGPAFWRESIVVLDEPSGPRQRRDRTLPGQDRTDGPGACRHSACLPLLHPHARAPAPLGRAIPAALSLPSEQVVLRRALRCAFREAGARDRARPVEGRGRCSDRRARARRLCRDDVGPRPPRGPAPDRLRLPLCLRHAHRHRADRELVPFRLEGLRHGPAPHPLGRHLPAHARGRAHPLRARDT